MKYNTSPKLFTTLNDELTAGKLLLPSFQRSYDWNESDGLALLDSIYKGFPIGSIYTWLTSIGNQVPLQSFNGLELKTDYSRNTDVAYLIDGQQRLTTLLRLYSKERDFDLFFDPTVAQFKPRKKTETYIFGQKVAKSKRHRLVSVKDIFRHSNEEEERFLESLGKDNFNTEEIENILLLRHQLKNFTLSVTEVSEAPIKEVLGLYTRINTSGRQLGWVDSFATPILLNILPNLKIEISDYLNSQSKEYEGFEDLFDTEFFLQAIVRKVHPKYFNSLRESSFKEIDLYTKEAIEDAFNTTKKGSLAVVKLLKNKLKIVTSKMVKKDFSVLLLTMALGNIDDVVKHRNQNDLAYYFLLTNIFDFYSSTQAQKIKSEHFNKIKEAILLSQDIFGTIQSINKELYEAIQKENGNKNYFNTQTLRNEKYTSGRNTKGFIALEYFLAYNRATTFTDFNAPVDFSDSHRHHIYPIAYIRDSQLNLEENVVNNIGNITFITSTSNTAFSNKSPIEYFDLFVEPDADSLALHAFPEEYLDYRKLTLDNAEIFIHQRLVKLVDELNSFLSKFEH